MEEIIQNIQFSHIGWAIGTPLIFIVIDVLTGLIIAWKNNDFKSSRMRSGLAKKFGELVYILVGIITKFALGIDLILYFVVGYICLMELSSLAENCDKLGVRLPKQLQGKLNNINNEKKDD